jgi:hypothetical protein
MMRIFYPSEYFEEEDEEKEVYGWIFRSDDGFMDTDDDDTDEDEQRRGEKREIWNCVVSEIGAKKITFDSSSSSSSHHLSDDDDDDDDDAVQRILFPRRNHKKETTKNENGKRNGKVIEAKRIGKIIFRNDDIDIDEHKGYTKSDENDNDNANDAEVYFVTFRLKACSHHVPFSVSVVDSKGRKREFDDILFVSVAREAIDATANIITRIRVITVVVLSTQRTKEWG